MSLNNRVYAQEYEIRDRLKALCSKARFSIHGLEARNRSMRDILKTAGLGAPARRLALSADFCGLEAHDCKSAACVFEQFRARLWVLSALRRHFTGQPNLHFVTLADERHRVAPEGLAAFRPSQAQYAITKAFSQLSKVAPGCQMLGVVEVSAGRYGNVILLEPHVHAVIAGASKKQLKAIIPGSPHYNRRVNSIYALKPCGFYITKFAAELRSDYRAPDGKLRRRRNKMGLNERAAWAAWGAHLKTADLVFSRGFPNDFQNTTCAELLDELLWPIRNTGALTSQTGSVHRQMLIRRGEL